MLALSFIPNQFLYPWTVDSLSYLYGLSTPWLRLTKKYISSISQRPQSHKIQAKQLKLIPGSHTDMKTKTRIGIPHLLSKPYPNIFISDFLSLKRKRYHILVLKVQGDEGTKEKRRNIMFPLPLEEEKASVEGHCRQEQGMR